MKYSSSRITEVVEVQQELNYCSPHRKEEKLPNLDVIIIHPNNNLPKSEKPKYEILKKIVFHERKQILALGETIIITIIENKEETIYH